MSSIDKALQLARERHPDLWERTDMIARIIDPAAFTWMTTNDSKAQRRLDTKQKYLRARARSKAHDVLHALGVNTDTDWLYILDRITEDD